MTTYSRPRRGHWRQWTDDASRSLTGRGAWSHNRTAGAYTLTADSGAFTLTGNAAGLTVQRKLAAAVGAFTLTGNVAGLAVGRKLAAGVGTFELAGQAAGLTAQRQIAAAAGAFVLTGVDADLVYTPASGSYTLTAEVGAFALTGNPAGLTVARKLAAGAGTFTLTGTDVGMSTTGQAQAATNHLHPGPARWYTRVGDKVVTGTKQEVEQLLAQLAQQHAEEDEDLIEQGEPPKKRAVRVVSPGRAKVETLTKAEPSVTAAKPVLQEAGLTPDQLQHIYEAAYARHIQREAIEAAIREDDDEFEGHLVRQVTERRALVGKALAALNERLKGLLQ